MPLTSDAGASTVRQLEQLVQRQCQLLVDAFFDNGKDVLNQLADSMDSRRLRDSRDSLLLLQKVRDDVTQRFIKSVTSALNPSAEAQENQSRVFDISELTLQDPAALDLDITANRIGNQIALRLDESLGLLVNRLDRFSYGLGADVQPDALRPDALCKQFADAVKPQGLEQRNAMLAVDLFGRSLLQTLDAAYRELIQFLESLNLDERHATIPPPGRSDRARTGQPQQQATTGDGTDGGGGGAAGGGAAGGGAGGGGAGGGGATGTSGQGGASQGAAHGAGGGDAAAGPPLDPNTMSVIRTLSQAGQRAASAVRYTDADLAMDLGQIAAGQAAPGWTPGAAQDAMQRMRAVGRVFNDLAPDKHIPAALKPKLEEMRFLVMKSALSSPDFFSDEKNTLRQLLNELLSLLVNSRLSTSRGEKNIDDLIGQIRRYFDVDADKLKPSESEERTPVSEEDIESFLKDQKKAQGSRRQDLIVKSRDIATDELWARTAHRQLPSAARQVFAYGWVPMAALNLLRNGGVNGQPWRQSLDLLDRIVEAVDPAMDVDVDIDALKGDFTDALRKVGMVPKRVSALLGHLDNAVRQGAADRVEQAGSQLIAPPPEVTDERQQVEKLFDRLIITNNWFKVYDPELDNIRWLRAVSHSQDEVRFAAFDGSRYSVPRDRFAQDLLEGRSDAVDSTPSVEEELQKIRSRFKGQDDTGEKTLLLD